MSKPLAIFKIKHEERLPAVAVMLYIVFWNCLVVHRYADKFFAVSDNYHDYFIKYFLISGYDPWSYAVLSQWDTEYNIYRHPLLAFFMWIPSQVNHALLSLTGMNWAPVVMSVILVFCAFYSFILLYRTFREVIGLPRVDSWLLGWLTFTFGYVMVSISVPDHFCLSMFMLVLTLYVAGRKLKAGHPFTKWQTILFFLVTAGISLNNGVKVFLTNLFVNGKKFFRPANLVFAVLLPAGAMWGVAVWEWNHFEQPKEMAQQQDRLRKDSMMRASIYQAVEDTISVKDEAAVRQAYNAVIRQRIIAKYKRDHRSAWNRNAGTPIKKSGFWQWTDVSTPRWASFVENYWGEPLQLHQDYLLHDVERNRPVIVKYRYAINYVVEAIIVMLFVVGIMYGCREKFLWLALTFMGFDFIIHFLLGFGVNEVYIMSPHWLFVVSLAIGYALKKSGHGVQHLLRAGVAMLAVYLLLWNGILYVRYLL